MLRLKSSLKLVDISQKVKFKSLFKIKNILIVIVSTITIFLLNANVNAVEQYDFETFSNVTMTYKQEWNYVEFSEIREIKANNPDYFIPAQDEQTYQIYTDSSDQNSDDFQLIYNNIEVFDLFNQEIEFEREINEDGIEVSFDYNQDIRYGSPYKYRVSYLTRDFMNSTGNIVNLEIPQLPEDILLESEDNIGATSKYNYNFEVKIYSDKEISFISPKNLSVIEKEDHTSITMSAQERINQLGWIQIGLEQYFYFRIEQEAPKTNNLTPTELNKYTDLLASNQIKIPIPRSYAENNQEVFIKQISPKPIEVERDREGNLIGVFEVPANEINKIVVEGYISMKRDTYDTELPAMPLDQYREEISRDSELLNLTEADQYWESNDSVITKRADQIMRGLPKNPSIIDLIRADYNYVINNFEYDEAKVTSDNERYGAKAAFLGASSVCMEYADATIALLRAQGIPARAAVGYGNDPNGVENILSDKEAILQPIGHQWVQVWIPDYGWLSIDPTWGETGREYIGGNLDHLLWYTLSYSETGYKGTWLRSADPVNNGILKGYDVYIKALSKSDFENIDMTDKTSLDDYISPIQPTYLTPIETYLKTTIAGRLLIILVPILIVFTITLTLSKGLYKVFKG